MKRSSMTPIALGLGWLMSLGIVYVMGLFTAFAFHAEPGMGSESGLKSVEREAQAVFEQLVGEPLDWPTLRSYRPQDRHPPQLEQMIEALSALPDPATRRVLTERFFLVVGEVKTVALIQENRAMVREKPDVFLGLLAAWHLTDASAAERFIDAMVQAGDASAELREALIE